MAFKHHTLACIAMVAHVHMPATTWAQDNVVGEAELKGAILPEKDFIPDYLGADSVSLSANILFEAESNGTYIPSKDYIPETFGDPTYSSENNVIGVAESEGAVLPEKNYEPIGFLNVKGDNIIGASQSEGAILPNKAEYTPKAQTSTSTTGDNTGTPTVGPTKPAPTVDPTVKEGGSTSEEGTSDPGVGPTNGIDQQRPSFLTTWRWDSILAIYIYICIGLVIAIIIGVICMCKMLKKKREAGKVKPGIETTQVDDDNEMHAQQVPIPQFEGKENEGQAPDSSRGFVQRGEPLVIHPQQFERIEQCESDVHVEGTATDDMQHAKPKPVFRYKRKINSSDEGDSAEKERTMAPVVAPTEDEKTMKMQNVGRIYEVNDENIKGKLDNSEISLDQHETDSRSGKIQSPGVQLDLARWNQTEYQISNDSMPTQPRQARIDNMIQQRQRGDSLKQHNSPR